MQIFLAYKGLEEHARARSRVFQRVFNQILANAIQIHTIRHQLIRRSIEANHEFQIRRVDPILHIRKNLRQQGVEAEQFLMQLDIAAAGFRQRKQAADHFFELFGAACDHLDIIAGSIAELLFFEQLDIADH